MFAQWLGAVSNNQAYVVSVTNEHGSYYYVMAVEPSKQRLLQGALKQPLDNVDLRKFGRILFSGRGTAPDNRIAAALKEKYKLDIKHH